jgi:hypothetical protein
MATASCIRAASDGRPPAASTAFARAWQNRLGLPRRSGQPPPLLGYFGDLGILD